MLYRLGTGLRPYPTQCCARQMPNNIYHWIESFFRNHSHCTVLGMIAVSSGRYWRVLYRGLAAAHNHKLSQPLHDLHATTPGNTNSCAAEIAPTEDWAQDNNLRLKQTKSEIFFVPPPKSRRSIVILPPAVPGCERVESIKDLGVTIIKIFSVVQHVDLLLMCADFYLPLPCIHIHTHTHNIC